MTGLTDPIKDQLAPLEVPRDLESLIAVSIRIDNRLRERERERWRTRDGNLSFQGFPQRAAPPGEVFKPAPSDRRRTAPPLDTYKPMQLDRTRLSLEERQHRLREGCCFYCGQMDHQLDSCPRGGRW
ncbi:hypothetical protein CgunFtcFv8_005154 [Champsocephalus gunnari]|uniref:CCHC-type domain-containing protein n=1 Tax=Champsocephalus gunnari TaxID=52237 RepID=A0AAN8CVR3_CHAGU|nr:hypothetical protein CgunFtcFv8_005154 [Champsocephalus gunnari]